MRTTNDWQEHVKTGWPMEGSGDHVKALEASNAALLAALEGAFDSWYDDPRHLEMREAGWVTMARQAIKDAKAT